MPPAQLARMARPVHQDRLAREQLVQLVQLVLAAPLDLLDLLALQEQLVPRVLPGHQVLQD